MAAKRKRGGWRREGVKVREKVKGSGVWWVFVNRTVTDAEGSKRLQRQSHRKGDLETAEAFANELRAGIKLVEARQRGLTIDELQRIGLAHENVGPEPESGLTFGAYASRVLDRWEPKASDPEHGLKFTTWQDYTACLNNRLIPSIGDRPLAGLKRRDGRRLAEDLRENGLKPGNVRKHMRVLSSILTEAVEDELIPANPLLGGGRSRRHRSKAQQVRRRQDPFTQEELATLFTTAETHTVERRGKTVRPFEPFIPLLLTLADCGVRLGEALGLQWGDFDWRAGVFHVRRAYTRGRLDVPKGGKPRKVEMTTRLRTLLRTIYEERFAKVAALDPEQQAALEAEQATRAAKALLFTDSAGGHVDPDNLRARIWVPLLTAAKLRQRRLHDLRHSFSTLHIQGGTDPIWVSAQLGHHSVAFTLATYAHLPLGDRGGHADRIVATAPNCAATAPAADNAVSPPELESEKPLAGQGVSQARPA